MTEAQVRHARPGVLRRLRRAFWKLLGWAIILSAVLVGLGRLAAPHADRIRPLVETALSERLGQPVSIRRLSASWPRFSPVLELEGLTLGAPESVQLQVERSRAEFRLYKLLLPSQNVVELVVVGLEWSLVQDEEGGWSWRLDRGGRVAGDWQRGLSAGDLLVRDSRLQVRPRALEPILIELPQARLRRIGSALEMQLEARLENAPIERLEARLRLALDDLGVEAVRGYAFAPRLRALAERGGAEGERLQAWLEWDRARGARFHLRSRVREAAPGVSGPGPSAQSLEMLLDGRWDAQGLAVEVNSGTGAEGRPLIDRLSLNLLDGGVGVSADSLDLSFLHALITPWIEGRFDRWPIRVEGSVQDLLAVASSSAGVSRLQGSIEGLGLQLQTPELGLDGLSLRLGLAGDRPTLALGGTPELNLPLLYERTLSLPRIGGRVEWLPRGLAFAALEIEHEDFELRVDGQLLAQDDGPFLDLQVQTPRLSATELHRWLPARGIGPNTRRWLERALVSVDRASADTVLFGRPLRWKQGVPNGALESRAQFRGLVLDYAPGWPVARDLRGEVRFLGESLLGRVDRGRIAGQILSAPRVEIGRFRAAEVELELESAGGDAASLAELSRSFPLPAARDALEAMRWSGPATAAATLWLPVRHLRDWRLLGRVELAAARFELPGPEITVHAIEGVVPFTRDRFGEARLTATVGQLPAEVTVDARLQPTLDLVVRGQMAPIGLIPARWKRERPELEAAIRGRSPMSLRIGKREEAFGESMSIRLSSQLQGTSIDLPEPLNKPADALWPLELHVPLGDDSIPFNVMLEPVGSALVLAGERPQIGLGFGDAPARLPMAEDFLVEGWISGLDLPGWIRLLATALGGRDTGAAEVEPSGWLNLAVGDLQVGSRRLGPARLELQREQDYWRFLVDGERLAGTVRLPGSADGDRDLVADFDRLHWPAVLAADGAPPAEPSDIDPSRLPALNLVIRDMRWGALELGRARLASHRVEQGIEVERFSLSGPGLEVTGSGRWTAREAPDSLPVTGLNMRLSSADLGRHLTEAGFDLGLERGTAAIDFAGRWPGSPPDFALQRVSGTLAVRIEDGAIPAAQPGAGRLLGLVSLSSIPRRLRLDFSDVFGEGLGFDRIAGDFVLTDGQARTDNLRIEAPAAEVRISGLTDLGQRSYDQLVAVRPGLGATLPVIGALAGGPVGAAAGAALQQILSRPLQGMSEVRYSVTGSWDDPRIEPIRENAPPGGA